MSTLAATVPRAAALPPRYDGALLTRLTRHPRLGFSRAAAGGVVHVIGDAWMRWLDGKPVGVSVHWACSSRYSTLDDVQLLDAPGGRRVCARCDIDVAQTAPEVLYAATVDGELLKVGITCSITRRMAETKWMLIGYAPGDAADEKRLLALLGRPVRGREFFPLTQSNVEKATDFLARLSGVQMNPATLTALRTLGGYSQNELSRRSGVSQGHISELERGAKSASPRTVKRLAEALGVPVAALMTTLAPGEQAS